MGLTMKVFMHVLVQECSTVQIPSERHSAHCACDVTEHEVLLHSCQFTVALSDAIYKP